MERSDGEAMSGTCKCGGECGECWCGERSDGGASEAEKAAREYAQSWTTLNDGTRIPAGIIHNKVEAFLVGVEWERKRIRDTYCPSYVLTPTMANQGEAKLCHVIPVGDLTKESEGE